MRKAVLPVIALLAIFAAEGFAQPKALVVCDMTERPFSLDPFKNLDGKVSFVLRHVLGPWIDRDTSHRLVPGVFKSWRATSSTTWEFGVRTDLRFPDGTALQAEDAAYSAQLAIAKGSALANEFGSVVSARALAPDRLEVTTRAPDPTLPARFANRPFLVAKAAHETQGTSYFERPQGVWAYKVTAIDDASMTLDRNPAFPDRIVGMQSITYRFIKDPVQRIEALKGGSLQILTELTPTMSLDVAKDPRLSVVKVTVAQYVGLFMNALPDRQGVFTDAGLREFLYAAVDVKRLIALAANGNGLPLATITMPEEFGYNPSLAPREADPALAQRRLDEWKAKTGSTGLALRIAVVDYLENVAKAVQGQLSRYGVRCELISMPRGDLISKVMQKKEVAVDCFIVDPQDPLLDAGFQLNIETNPSYPTAYYSSAEIGTLLGKANVEMDPATRAGLLGQVQSAIYKDFGPLPLYQKIALYGVAKTVKGFNPLADIYLRLEGVTVDK